jgi:hypothetical protein
MPSVSRIQAALAALGGGGPQVVVGEVLHAPLHRLEVADHRLDDAEALTEAIGEVGGGRVGGDLDADDRLRRSDPHRLQHPRGITPQPHRGVDDARPAQPLARQQRPQRRHQERLVLHAALDHQLAVLELRRDHDLAGAAQPDQRQQRLEVFDQILAANSLQIADIDAREERLRERAKEP